ncbi:MAG: hypothetical protein ABR530_05765 [Pyrinomonadaceae bacterium]
MTIKHSQRIVRKQPQKPSNNWPTYVGMAACALILVGGFFLAGRQHFSSMVYGMKNSRLQKQLEDLEAHKRRLLLAREVSLSPAEIKKAAKKVGLTDQSSQPAQIVPLVASATALRKAPNKETPTAKSMVVKTAAVSPVPRPMVAKYQKIERIPRDPRKSSAE